MTTRRWLLRDRNNLAGRDEGFGVHRLGWRVGRIRRCFDELSRTDE